MKKAITISLFLLSGCALAAQLNLNDSVINLADQPSRMDCDGLTVVAQETTSCCTGSVCSDHSSLNLLRHENQNLCPRIIIDGYIYDLSGPIDIHQSLLLFIAQSDDLANCQNGSGSAPTLGSGFLAVINTDTIGVASSEIDVGHWALRVNSIDGDVVCDGGTPFGVPDLIFIDGFD